MPLSVKVGDKVFSSDEVPILLIFKDIHKMCHKTVTNNKENVVKYCAYPENMEEDSVDRFMEISNDGPKT